MKQSAVENDCYVGGIASAADLTVLVVDDEALVLPMVEDMLGDLGARTVHSAADLATALNVAGTGEFDIALLDVNIRGLSIRPVVDVLRGRRVPIVFATA